ncbi:peptidoglycan-binding protein [Sphingobium sp. SYK-6]|uniref:peptidoglycan-binding protein n=1 Tax=Sphingobium sp. (strain NBRC 103272 / SYK-6) TaxID=627192 RepID=UPI003FA7A468
MPSSAAPDRATPPQLGPGAAIQARADRFRAIVRRVQIGLMGQGEYRGIIDGDVGPATRAALRRFQTSHGLTVTGTITPQVLDALRIASN